MSPFKFCRVNRNLACPDTICHLLFLNSGTRIAKIFPSEFGLDSENAKIRHPAEISRSAVKSMTLMTYGSCLVLYCADGGRRSQVIIKFLAAGRDVTAHARVPSKCSKRAPRSRR